MATRLATEQPISTPVITEPVSREVREEATTAKSNKPVMVVLAILAVYIIWGSTYFAIKVTLDSFPPFLMAGMRFVLAGGILFGYMKLRGAPTPNLKQWGASALVGCLLLAGGYGFIPFS